MATDAELLLAWRNADAEAGRQLCERYYETLVRFFGNKVAEDLADLVQDTFAACVERRDHIEQAEQFRSYLFGIAYNVFKHHLRRKYRTAEDEISSRSLHDIAPGPSTMLREDEQRRRLLLALRQLPVDMQVALELKYWEELSSPEIAAVLGVQPATVRSYLRRGRLMLEQKMSGAEVH